MRYFRWADNSDWSNMIKNIIFDVGNVLIGYRWKDMLMEHGLTEEEAIEMGERIFEDPLWGTLDIGIVDPATVIGHYKEKYPEHAETISWFITHGEFMHVARKRVWSQIPKLKEKGYKIYLLSNYSEDLFKKHTKDASFMKQLDGMVVSYQKNVCKPDQKIYEYLLKDYDLKPQECLFFDDRLENIERAKQLQFHAIQILSENQLLEELNALC